MKCPLYTQSYVIPRVIIVLGPCVPNKKGDPKGELTLRSVITRGSKGELAIRWHIFLFGAHGPYQLYTYDSYMYNS